MSKAAGFAVLRNLFQAKLSKAGRQRYKNDYIKFLTYALASRNKTIDHLEILNETGSLKVSKIKGAIMKRNFRVLLSSIFTVGYLSLFSCAANYNNADYDRMTRFFYNGRQSVLPEYEKTIKNKSISIHIDSNNFIIEYDEDLMDLIEEIGKEDLGTIQDSLSRHHFTPTVQLKLAKKLTSFFNKHFSKSMQLQSHFARTMILSTSEAGKLKPHYFVFDDFRNLVLHIPYDESDSATKTPSEEVKTDFALFIEDWNISAKRDTLTKLYDLNIKAKFAFWDNHLRQVVSYGVSNVLLKAVERELMAKLDKRQPLTENYWVSFIHAQAFDILKRSPFYKDPKRMYAIK